MEVPAALRLIERLNSIRVSEDADPRISIFKALVPGENALSRVLAYVFTGHAESDKCLKCFLKLVGSHEGFGRVQAQTEYPCKEIWDPKIGGVRRIDIVLRLDNQVIAIENKPWAGEQELQCSDYARELTRNWGDRWKLVFLTQDGRSPTNMREGDEVLYSDRLIGLRYDDLSKALSDLRPADAYLSLFLSDFHRFVIENINGERFVSSNDKRIIDVFFEEQFLPLTAEFLLYSEEIAGKMTSRLLAKLEKELAGKYPKAQWVGFFRNDVDRRAPQNFNRPYSGIYFTKPEWEGKYSIGFENQSPHGAHVWFGIKYARKLCSATPDELQLAVDLNNHLQAEGKSNQYWIWGAYLANLGYKEYSNWSDPDVVRQMTMLQQMTSSLFGLMTSVLDFIGDRLDGKAQIPSGSES